MNPQLQSLILSTLLQGATSGKPVTFYWSERLKLVKTEKFERGISITIPRKAFIKESIKTKPKETK